MASLHYSRSRELSHNAAKTETLLNRYPDVSDAELDTLIRSFAKFPLLDFGILAADDRLGPKLDAFYRDHSDKLRPPLSDVVWAVAVPAVIAVAAILYWLVT